MPEATQTMERRIRGGSNDADQAFEIALLREFREGKREAFTQLYLRYRQRVFAYCLRMLGSSVEAEDMFQEVFIRVWQRSYQFTEEKSVSGWIFTIAHNLCLNRIRDRKVLDRLDDHTNLTVEHVELGENWGERIQLALEQVPPENREPFVLFEYQGLSYQEIANVMKLSVAAIKSRIYRAREELRRILEPYYRDEI
ncbi:MAG: RNA polymerase sigma factor [Bacteroidetes bacterium]|nr:RNA polymerase sigma factor [Bacteroidota bacterium]